MGFKDWFNDKFGGGGSDDSTSSSTYDIDYEQLDRNDSYSPYQNTKESGQTYKQYQQAYNQYQQAQRNQNEYAGWQTDDMSAANARAAIENARQASESAYQNWQKTVNPLVPNTPSYTPTYQNTRNPFAAYDPAEWQISQAEGARNSPTDYLTGAERAAIANQTSNTNNGVYGTPKTSNPFGPATSQTQYYPWERPNLDQTGTRGTDASNPLFPSGKLESSPDTGSRGSIIDRFRKDAETLESMYYNPVKEPQFNLGEMLKNGRNLLFPERTDEQKAAKAELDQAKFELAHSGGSNRAAAQERLDKAQAAYDDVTKKLEKEAVTAVDNGTTGTNPKLQELYDSMSPFRRALRRFELAAEGGLQLGALATFVTTPLTVATSTLQKLAGDIPTALDIPLAARFAYQVANGKANPVKEGVGVESFTQKQWDALPESAKYQLSTIYKITNLDEFNEALKTANDLVRSNDVYKEGMSNIRDEYLFDEKIKAFHDYSQRMVDEAGYGLNKFEQFAIKLIPSGIDMAVDAVFNNWSGLAHAGLGLMADRIFGETYYDDRLAGHDHEHASAHALASAVVEVTSELIGGESVMDTLAYGNKGVFTEGIDAAIAKIGNPLMQAAAKYAAGTGSEIIEEEFSQVVSPFVDALLEESPYLQTVIEKYGEQRAQEYVEAALGAILLTGVGNATGDIATSVANRAGEARGKYEAPNIDGTTTEENPSGKKAYSQTMQQVANINRNRNMDQNALIQSIYGRAKEAGASDEQAKAVANDVYDMKGKAGKDIYNEFVKFNDGTKTREEIDAAIEAFKPELLEAEEGYVVLDADNKSVGTVKTVNDYGITVQFNDGTTESAILNGVGSGGMLDPNSRLAKVLGNNGTVVDADTADIYSRNAEQERKAQIKAGEEMQDRGEKAQPQAAAQPPKADTPAPHKAPTPAKAQPTQQQTTQQEAPQQEQPRNTTGEQRAEQQQPNAPTGPQFQNQDVYDNNKYEVEQSANGYYVKQPDGGLVGPFETYEQAMGMVSQFSQQNPAPQTQETQEAETPVQTQEESQPEVTQEQEAPSEPEAPPSRSPLTDSVTEANTVTENNGTPSKAEQYFADNPKKTTYQTTYKEAGVKIKKNADGTFTVSMASLKKNGQGWTKGVSAIGTVNSISEANQLVVDEYSKKSAPKALTDSATGTPIESPQNGSQSVSREEGNSVLPNEQNASETQNEELNSKPDKNIKAKQNLTDEEELARLDGGIADTEFNPDNPMSPKKAQNLNRNERIERTQKWANYFGIKSDVHGLYDRLIGYITNPESTITDAQMDELFALLSQSAEIKSAQQEQRMAKTEGQTEEQEEDETTQTKYKDPLLGYDFTPDESDAEEAYDWKKVSQYMAEYDRSTVMERKSVLEGLFPDKEFRIADDGGSVEEVYKHKTSKSPFTKEEQSWWRKHGYEEITKKFKKSFFGADYLIPAWLRNGTYNKNLTDVTEEGKMGNRLSVRSMQYRGLRYYYQVGEGMYRHILDSNIMNGIRSVVERHEERVKNLKTRIENGYLYAEMPNELSGISTERALQTVQQLEKQLKAEEGWLEKVRSGKYTLGNFYSDRSGVVTEADIQTVLDSVKGEDKTFENYSLKALQNAMSETMAKELIDSIYKEATDGINQEQSTNSTGDYQRVEAADQSTETGKAPSSVSGLSVYEQASQNQSESAETGRLMDDSGTVSEVSGQGSTGRKTGRRPLTGDEISTAAQEATDSINNWSEPADLTIRPKGAKPGATIPVKYIGGNIYLDGEAVGEIVPENYEGRLRQIAQQIKDAAAETGLSIVQIRGQLYSLNDDRDGSKFTNRTTAFAELSEGYIAISEITDESAGELILDTIHEITHENTLNQFGTDSTAILSFIDDLSETSGIDIKSKAQKVIRAYSADGVTFDSDCADEMISRIAEGHDCNGDFTAEEVVRLQEALFGSPYYDVATDSAPATAALLDYSRTQARNRPGAPNVGRVRAATDVGYTPSAEPQEDRLSEVVQAQRGTESQQTREQRRTALSINVAVAIQNGDLARAQRLINEAGTTQQRDSGLYSDEMVGMYRRSAQGEGRVPSDLRMKEDLDQYSDESFDALVNDTSYEEASAINGQNYDQYDLNSELGAEQASETETLNSMSGRGVDTTAAPIENFQNAEQSSENAAIEDLSGTGVDTERTPIDYFQSQEQASESDLIREQSRNDLTGSEDTNFESPYEAEQRTEQEAMDSLYENMDGRKLTSPKRTANDYYGSAYARVQETQKKHKRNKARSSFSIAELYYKTYGETNDSIRNFKRLQKLNSNVDSLLDGKMSYYDFNSFAKNMSSRQGIGQILNDDIQNELDRVVALEEAAQGKSVDDQATKDFQYAAANVVSHIVARMDMVEKTERARARLDTAAKKHGAKGGRKNLVGSALDAWNRYQITGDNFWRMMDDWAGKGQGYSYAREHLKTIATRISEEAKLKGYFEGIDKNSKEFKDFASGTTMSNVDFNGHKISLMEGIKFVKTVDTLRMFASENGRPSWQRVAALGGFTFEGKNGKPIFVDIQGSYDNNAAARAAWVEQRYNQLKQEIANNKAASAYMSAVEEMYYEASKDAEKVHSKVNGYDRYMYGKGWYTDIHYANKNSGTVDFRYSDRDATDVHDTASMQKRSKVAGGYAIINPMSRSVDAYISQISNYIAFEEFGQKLGVLSDSKSINGSYANTVRDAYGDQYSQWFDNYVKTMTLYKENKPKGGMNSALAKARQAMMSGALIGSVSVPIKQVSSFFDTMGTLDPRAVAVAFGTNPLGRKQKGIKNYLMDSRNQSISDPDLAELFGDKGILRKIKDTRIGKLAMSATNMMDATAVSNVYRACVLDVEYNNPLGKSIYNNGKNFKDGLTAEGQFYVDAKFEEALLGSQPIFTPQARNELARTDNQFLRMFSTFRTQQTQNYNRMLQTWNEYQAARKNDGDTKETGKKFVQTMTGQMIASASLSALTAIANAVLHKHRRYKDDDDELDEEKFWQRFGLGAFESLMGNSLFVGDITKWAIDLYNSQNDPNWNWKYSTKESQYFDSIEGMHIPIPASGAIGTAIQALNSAINLYRDVDENGWSDQNKLSARYLAGNIATAFGVQLNNVYYALNAGYQWYMDAAQLVTGDKKYEKKYDDIFTQMVKVDYSQQNRLVNSILAGKTQKVADMFDDMGQDKFENAVYYGAFDQYKAGKIDKAEYVELLMNFAGKSYKEASNEVEKKSRLLESGISQYNGIDGRDGRKAFYDQYSGNFQSRDAYKQFFEDVKNGKAEGKHNTYYTQWYGQPQEVSANQSSIIDTMNRNIQAGNFSYDTAKLLWENYYGYSTSKYSAWKFVGK